jgi:hypothetical protein
MDSDTLIISILTFILGFLINDKIHATWQKHNKHQNKNTKVS